MTSDIYCAEQIKIPPTFAYILKVYAKAAIRTQPYDLLKWTCAYFRALAKNEVPPVKERLEYPPFSHPTGITPGYLKTLLNMFGRVEEIELTTLLLTWQGIALPETTLFRILTAGKFLPAKFCYFYKFLATCCGFLAKNLLETMVYVCELLTEEPEGGSSMIPLLTFLNLYVFLAELDCSGECVCATIDDQARSLFRPCGLSTDSDQSTTIDSKLFQISSTIVEEAEDTGMQDVCGSAVSQDSQISESLRVLKEFKVDKRHSEVDQLITSKEGQQQQLAAADATNQGEQQEQLKTVEAMENMLQQNNQSPFFETDDFYKDDEPYMPFDDGEEGEEAVLSSEQSTDGGYKPIGLKDILKGICECLEPVVEVARTPTPPPPDPFEEFLKRMKLEVEEDRLDLVFRVDGIGGRVSTNRITAVGVWLADCARRQEGLVGPRNIKHFLCPELEDIPDNNPDIYD